MPPLTETGNNERAKQLQLDEVHLEALLSRRIRRKLGLCKDLEQYNDFENCADLDHPNAEPVHSPRYLSCRDKLFIRTRTPSPQYDGPNEDFPAASTSARRKTAGLQRRPSLKSFRTLTSTGSMKSLDRFLPTRKPTFTRAVESFRSNKDHDALSANERLLRNKEASPDAFSPRRAVSSPVSRSNASLIMRTVSGSRSTNGGASILAFHRDPPAANGERQVSVGTVWTVGGLAPFSSAVPDGQGGFLGSGTNAPMYTTSFTSGRRKPEEDNEKHESRLAEALDLDRTSRVLMFGDRSVSSRKSRSNDKAKSVDVDSKTVWRGTEWVTGSPTRILDAPNLRDDFYCSVLAYSATCHTLAVGLGPFLYSWSETKGVALLSEGKDKTSWLTSIAFSSTQGCKCILAFGRSDGCFTLMSIYDSVDKVIVPRFEMQHRYPIACVMWKPVFTLRLSRSPANPGILIKMEDLLVGDEVGCIYYYCVEWPDTWEIAKNGWMGSVVLLARVSTHTQQICGLSFSPDGNMFATGGNDNLCCLFQTNVVLQNAQATAEVVFSGAVGFLNLHRIITEARFKEIQSGSEQHRWVHGAAVKAIAFCPWRDGLIATGGGSNDKCIHFFHTPSGACLAKISVAAQVTSLIWSTTRREIVATFGYAQPDHPYRIAIFSWPDCKQVAAIPWEGEHRALYAIRYQGGPNESQTSRKGGHCLTRTALEGCIVVASSDESLKFQEIWSAGPKATAGVVGLLGGSDILEGLDGIDKEGEVIR